MIIVTGATELVGGALVAKLNSEGFNDLILVDEIAEETSFHEIKYTGIVRPAALDEFLRFNHLHIEFVYHVANNPVLFDEEFARRVWDRCVEFGFPLVFTHTALGYTARPEESVLSFSRWMHTQERRPYLLVCVQLPVDENFGVLEDERNSDKYRLIASNNSDYFISGEETPNFREKRFAHLEDSLYYFLHNRKQSGVYLLEHII